ncbi:hypothetical protein FE257_000698 [Aspergillus nanangensis]|uniref:ER membrane protein complex subunit 2 n=1 Tax=Aspergillus nanangensis TaxID=2582783 RepID=A0AAD4CEP3_ASPNN|nr:hypothetical protein FE257_000698 [Aspergillus nanangensis]
MTAATADPYALDHSNLIATLRFSQQAPLILGQKQAAPDSDSIFSATHTRDDPAKYGTIEQLFFSCLQTGDDESAHKCLDQLTQRFGPSNERIQGLRGLYEEAISGKPVDLEECLRKHNDALSENPMNIPILKRRISLLRSLARPAEAIGGLVELLKAVPTDAESWCELADLYRSQGMTSQAVFCLEEALLIVPNAWNVHARLGELLYTSACSSEGDSSCRVLEKSIRYFCRSVELCDDYLRGLYGLALATSPFSESKHASDLVQESTPALGSGIISKDTFAKLNAFATEKLDNIVQHRSLNHQLWEVEQAELIAAKALLDRIKNPA